MTFSLVSSLCIVQASEVEDTFFLSSRVGTAQSHVILPEDYSCQITVAGSISVWSARNYNVLCPYNTLPPEDAPEYPSPDVGNGPTGLDAEYAFAVVNGSSLCKSNIPIPFHFNHIEFDLGNGFFEPVHTMPVGEGYNPEHVYIYREKGAGSVLTAQYLGSVYDNYGEFKIDIACDPDNSVELTRFEAKSVGNNVLVQWETDTEIDNVGFYLWRAEPVAGQTCEETALADYENPKNLTFEPSKAIGGNSNVGNSYTYVDIHVYKGITYCYALEDIEVDGDTQFSQVISIVID
jgi:hypothetical protein